MALNFPDSPTLNQVYTDTTSGFSYQWDGVVWQSYSAPASKNISIVDNIESSFNGATQTFPLAVSGTALTPANAQQLRVVLGGIVQEPLTDYTVSGSNITFTTAPTGGLDCSIVSLGPAVSVSVPGDGTVTPAKLSTGGPYWNTGGDVVITGTGTTALLVNGNARVTGILTVGTSSITLDGTNNTINVGSLSISQGGISGGTPNINVGFITATGASISGSVTVGGNVSIAGTLTYEDVTNVDSVGLVTARSGIKLTGGDVTLGTGVTISGATSNTFTLSTNGSERVRVDSSGRLAIGTTTPATDVLLTVGGNDTDSGIMLDRSSGDNCAIHNVGGNLVFKNGGNSTVSGLNERARIDSSGRLLVGTSSALGTTGRLLEVANNIAISSYIGNQFAYELTFNKSRGSTNGTIVQNGDTIGSITFRADDGTDTDSVAARIFADVDGTPGANDMPGRLVFSTTADGASSPTERARIINSGFFKASNNGSYSSTTSSEHEFNQTTSANWTLRNRNTNAAPLGVIIEYSGAAPNGTGNEFLYCFDTGALRASIRSNGGLANYSANNANLSDRNAKKDITPAAGTWDCIKEWEIVNYRYKDQPDDADLNLGVIAQQVAESCPEVITVFEEAKDDQPEKLGIKEQQMYWMAIKALQEAQVRIEALEAEVAALKAQ